MEFTYQGRTHLLRGLLRGVSLVGDSQLPKLMHNSMHLCLLHLLPQGYMEGPSLIQCCQGETVNTAALDSLLEEFEDIFQDPTTLPLSRGIYDHRIPLQPGATPVNIRPYRYPLKQKDIIEKLVEKMLDSGSAYLQSFCFFCFSCGFGQQKGWFLEALCGL